MNRVFIMTVPAQDVARPPGILSILSACCETAGADYDLLDVNLHMYHTLPDDVTTELTNDFLANQFRSQVNQEWFDKVCDYTIEKILQYNPTHIAISVFTYASILSTFHVIQRIKQAGITSKIVLGGLGLYNEVDNITGTDAFGDYCLKNQLADYCIFGEGDIAFVQLLQGNVSYPGINQHNEQQITDLDSVPVPSYKKINPAQYFHAGEPEVLVTGSRGCVRDCSFCDVGHYWSRYVYKSGTRIAQELFDIWQTTGVNRFDFSDSLINGSIKAFRQFNKELIRLKSLHPTFDPRYKGQFICRPQGQLKEQDYCDIASAGAETLVVGIESFSEAIRTHMRKHYNNDAIDWHFEMCAKYNIKNVLLLLSGYITETIEDHRTTLDYLQKYQVYALSRTIYAINIDIDGLKIYQGSPLWDMQDELGVAYLHDNEKWKYGNWISSKNPTLTPLERLRRGAETIQHAYQLGYKVLHFNKKVDGAIQQYQQLKTQPLVFKIESS
jgi:hypothetical protein